MRQVLDHFKNNKAIHLARSYLRLTLDKVEPLWNELFAVVHDEHAAHVELDVVLLLASLEHIEGSLSRERRKEEAHVNGTAERTS